MRERRSPADLLARQIFPALSGNDQRTVRREHAFFQEKGKVRARGEHGALPVHLAADDGKLRDDAMQLGRLAEQLCQTFQGGHALSDLHAAAVQDVHDRGRIFLCERKHPKHLFAARLTDAAVQDGKILRGNIDGIPVDRRKAGHDAFTLRFRIEKFVFRKAEAGQFDETVFVDQRRNRLADLRSRSKNLFTP